MNSIRKLIDIITEAYLNEDDLGTLDTDVLDRVGPRKRYEEKEFQEIYQMLDNAGAFQHGIDSREISALAKENYIDLEDRTAKGLYLALIRMYLMSTGDVPDGLTHNPEWYDSTSEPMRDFLKSKGVDVSKNIAAAKEISRERLERAAREKDRMGIIDAVTRHWAKIKDNQLNSKQRKQAKQMGLGNLRDAVVKDMIENGSDVDQAFAKVLGEPAKMSEEGISENSSADYTGTYRKTDFEKFIKSRIPEDLTMDISDIDFLFGEKFDLDGEAPYKAIAFITDVEPGHYSPGSPELPDEPASAEGYEDVNADVKYMALMYDLSYANQEDLVVVKRTTPQEAGAILDYVEEDLITHVNKERNHNPFDDY